MGRSSCHGYKYYTRRAVSVNGKFSHNLYEEHIVMARNAEEANVAVSKLLRKEVSTKIGNETLTSHAEIVYAAVYLGRVKYVRTIEYEMPENIGRKQYGLSNMVGRGAEYESQVVRSKANKEGDCGSGEDEGVR